MKSISGLFACVAFVAIASSASAAETPRPTFFDVIRALSHERGDNTIPAAWAGVWNFVDSDYDCITKEFIGTDANVDTLCTGTPVIDDEGFKLNCSGTIDDTSVDVTCTYTEELDKGCSVTISISLEGTRSGDTANVTTTFSQDYTPDGCAFGIPDNCTRTEGVGSRIGPEPAECATPVDAVTWGRVKAGYR